VETPSPGSPRAKFNRGVEHIEILHGEIDRFAKDNPDPRIEKFDPKTGRYTLRLKFGRNPNGERWGLLLGDAIQNFRSALDHVVWQLVLANGKRPGENNRWPMGMSGKGYWCPKKNGRPSLRDDALQGVAEEPRTIIDGLQPYRYGIDRDKHFATLLAAISNADKHRVLQAGWVGVGHPPDGFLSRNEHVGDVIEGTWATGPLDEKAQIVDCRFAITGPDPHVQMQGELTLLIGFGREGFNWGAITEIPVPVGQIIDIFEPYFGSK
jgi:hypothetical protein